MKSKLRMDVSKTKVAALGIDPAEWERLRAGEHSEPHRLLGAHAPTPGGSA